MMATKATPTSAITASHKLATPPAPKTSTITFTVMARKIFCQTIFLVIFPILISFWIVEKSYLLYDICYLSPAMVLIVSATIIVLKTKEIKPCIRTNLLITLELTFTSET